MKKIIMMLFAMVLVTPFYASAQMSEKETKKAINAKLKEYKKEKWQVLGTGTLEMGLAKHYDRLNTLADKGREIEGISVKTKSKNLAKQSANTNARVTYASECQSEMRGRAFTELFSDGTDPDNEFDKFCQSFENLVQKSIGDELEPTFSIIRTNPDGTYEVRSYFVLNEKTAAKSQQKALNEAVKTTDLMTKYGDKMHKFINSAFQE